MSETDNAITIDYRMLNPVAYHLIKWLQDATIRQVILYGGSSSGKSYSVAQVFLLLLFFEGKNMMVMRKVGASIKESIYASFKAAADQMGMRSMFIFKDGLREIHCLHNGAKIVFKGLDDSEKIKGLESIKRVFMDEWNEYEESDYKQMKLRLRGMEGQQLVFAFNPIKETHWIKKNVFDKEQWHDIPMDVEIFGEQMPKELTEVKSIRMNSPKQIMHKRTGDIITHPSDMVVIQSTYLNNFWVIGSPDGTYGYYDDQCIANFENDRLNDPDYYNVYALGEWGVIRTGSEFFGSFNRGVHCQAVKYDPTLPIHISVDNNVLPYITITYWQIVIGESTTIRQLGETCAESPNNTVRKSAKLVAKRLHEFGVDSVFLHGDASTRAANTLDEEKRSFLDLFIDTLKSEGIEVTDCVGNKNPSVPMSGEFINAIFDGQIPLTDIVINETCNTSIEDYLSVQKDVNGAILKTKVKNKTTMQTYEEHGHISDTFRYIVCDVLRESFTAFSNRRKRNIYAKDGFIKFYNPTAENVYTADLLYVLPNINGKMSMVHGRLCGDKWHIVSAAVEETVSLELISDRIKSEGAPTTVVECNKSYFAFVRSLREILPEVRVKNESDDIKRRVAATSDVVRDMVLFNPDAADADAGYGAFLTNMLDYGKDAEIIEASAAISGFIQFATKWIFSQN